MALTITYEPTGENVVDVGGSVSFQTVVGLGALTLPGYSVPSGYTEVETVYSTGNPAAVIGTGGYFVRFFYLGNKANVLTEFPMDDDTALATAQTTIQTALSAGDTALILKSDGSAGS